jgi:Fic family protein
MRQLKTISSTPYRYDEELNVRLSKIAERVNSLRASGSLSPGVLKRIRKYFKIKNIYNSNAIEGNQLDYNETRVVVEEGVTISGKPLKDTLEAKNLSHALELFENLADREGEPFLETDIRNLHLAVLKDINDREAGKYRDVEVMISGSQHKPPGPESVAPEMQKLGAWLRQISQPLTTSDKSNPIVLACAAHTWFVFIHPFIDGNGRVARLILNLMLMRYGCPIAVITREDRQRYYEALGESDKTGDLSSIVSLVAESVEESLEEYLSAVEQHRSEEEWAKSLVSRFSENDRTKALNDHGVWKSAMDLLKNYFKQIADLLNEKAKTHGLARFGVKEYGALDFEKFLILRQGRAAKMTWFFGIEFQHDGHKERYLFFFGFISPALRTKLGSNSVTLHISAAEGEAPYERIDASKRNNLPNLCEIGYLPEQEKFCWRLKNGIISSGRVEMAAKEFFEQITR